jgi:hypothetical protein
MKANSLGFWLAIPVAAASVQCARTLLDPNTSAAGPDSPNFEVQGLTPGQQVSGVIYVSAVPSAGVTGTRIAFLVDGATVNIDSVEPYRMGDATGSYDAGALAGGDHTVRVVLYSDQGQTEKSVPFSVLSTQPGAGRSCPALPQFPTPACTGTPAGTVLTLVSGDVTFSTPGEIISGRHVTGNVTIAADDITIKDSQIDGQIDNWNGGDPYTYTVMDTTVGPATGCNSAVAIGSGRYTATRVLVRNSSQGFRISHDDVTIKDSYVLLCYNGGDSPVGIWADGGSNAVVQHNTIDQRPAEPYTFAAIFWQDTTGSGSTIADNLLVGGIYSVCIYAGPTTFTNNRVMDNPLAGLLGPVDSTCSLITWSGNTLVDIDSSYDVTSTVGQLPCSELVLLPFDVEGLTVGQQVSGIIYVSAIPSAGLTGVSFDFSIDGTPINSDSTAPYCMGGDVGGTPNGYDTSALAAGDHIVTVTLHSDQMQATTIFSFSVQ